MQSRLSTIFPFLLITLFCVGGVEALYFSVERYLLVTEEKAAAVKEKVGEESVEKKIDRKDVDHSVIMKRNLFGPPPVKEDVTGKIAVPESLDELEATSLDIVLMGTIHGVNDDNRAVILTKKDRKQEIFKVGDSVQGALIKEIRRGKIVITVSGKDESLDMSEAGKYGNTKSAGPVAAAAPRRRPPASALPSGGQSVEGDGQQVRPRVVRPTRKIVSSRRRQASDTQEEQPDEVADRLEEPAEQDITESAESGNAVE